jgi:hypothetical protein
MALFKKKEKIEEAKDLDDELYVEDSDASEDSPIRPIGEAVGEEPQEASDKKEKKKKEKKPKKEKKT